MLFSAQTLPSLSCVLCWPCLENGTHRSRWRAANVGGLNPINLSDKLTEWREQLNTHGIHWHAGDAAGPDLRGDTGTVQQGKRESSREQV